MASQHTTSMKDAPWLSIWIRPRGTIRQLLETRPSHSALVFAAASGVVQSMMQGAQSNVGARAPLQTILLMAIPIGAVWGLLQVHLLAGLFYLTARWTGLSSSFARVRAVVAWASLPLATSHLFWLGGIVLLGRSLFVNADTIEAIGRPDLFLGAGVVLLATGGLWLWSAVILVLGLAEVQTISVARAIGILLTALFMFAVIFVLVVVLASVIL